jgi:hypothetical protein
LQCARHVAPVIASLRAIALGSLGRRRRCRRRQDRMRVSRARARDLRSGMQDVRLRAARTQGRTLARLLRNRTSTETQLIRHDLTPEELASFRKSASTRLLGLRDAILAGDVEVHAQIPPDGDLLDGVAKVLTEILDRDLPLAPAIPGKK